MAAQFDWFVVFAEMRTGSNFLETNLNALTGVACHGEAFNPHFIGYPNRTEVLGISRSERDEDPRRLLVAMKAQKGTLCGFRYFHDHDPRVLDAIIEDPACAKIVLTRNPLDSYVSWKIAKATNQWKLTDVKRRKEAIAQFDAAEFSAHVAELQGFQVMLLNRLQVSGQTAFYIAYEDLQDLAVMNGLARWLGVEARLDELDQSLKVQNPQPTAEKVANPEVMARALADLDAFNLARTPNFEPRRGAAVPSYVGGARTPLLYMPVRGGPEEQVVRWLAALDDVDEGDLPTRMNQKQLRQWKKSMPGHRSFAVLRHPVARSHSVFCRRILFTGAGSFLKIRDTLKSQYKMPLPDDPKAPGYTAARHREAFGAFLTFVKANLAGQTGLRVDAAWSTQTQSLASFADFALPDYVLREEELADVLPDLARRAGHPGPASYAEPEADQPHPLDAIYDADLEGLVADAYQRDYLMFGFGPWRP